MTDRWRMDRWMDEWRVAFTISLVFFTVFESMGIIKAPK